MTFPSLGFIRASSGRRVHRPVTLQVTVSETGSHGDQYCDIQQYYQRVHTTARQIPKKIQKFIGMTQQKIGFILQLCKSITTSSMALVNTEGRWRDGRTPPPMKPPLYFQQILKKLLKIFSQGLLGDSVG